MKVLVTGASGFIGGALVPRLLGEGHEVRVLVREENGIRGRDWAAGVDVHRADIGLPAQLSGCCRGQDAVIHCAGLAHRNAAGGADHQQAHVAGTANLLNEAVKSGVGKFLYLSSSKAASRRPGSYGEAKRAAETLLRDVQRRGELQTCCLRPAAVYGPGMKGNLAAWIERTRQGKVPPLPPTGTRIAMIGREDLCRAISRALAAKGAWGETFLLNDGFPYLVKEIENHIRRALGRAPASWYPPKAAFAMAAVLGDIAGKIPGCDFGFDRSGYNTLFCDEFRHDPAFSRVTGFRPEQNFYEALPAILAE